MLLSEKQAAEEAKKAASEAESKNVDLAKKIEEAEGKVDQLQESTQRYIYGKLVKLRIDMINYNETFFLPFLLIHLFPLIECGETHVVY